MALDTNKCMANIIAKIEAQPTAERQAEFIELHSSFALKAVLGYGMDPGVKWLLPPGDPPFRPLEQSADQEGRFYIECKKLIYFVDSDEGRPINPLKREQLFIQVLESVDPRDAKLILRMKSRNINIRPEAIQMVYPKMWEAWGRKVATRVIEVEEAPVVQDITFSEQKMESPVKRGRGRPKGAAKKVEVA